jgi:hypothetical protein
MVADNPPGLCFASSRRIPCSRVTGQASEYFLDAPSDIFFTIIPGKRFQSFPAVVLNGFLLFVEISGFPVSENPRCLCHFFYTGNLGFQSGDFLPVIPLSLSLRLCPEAGHIFVSERHCFGSSAACGTRPPSGCRVDPSLAFALWAGIGYLDLSPATAYFAQGEFSLLLMDVDIAPGDIHLPIDIPANAGTDFLSAAPNHLRRCSAV